MHVSNISDKSLKEFKELCEKEGIKYETELEYKQSAMNLVNFVGTLVEIDMAERERKHRLIKEPKGFELEGKGRSCSLCGRSVYEGYGWYDKWGFKCTNCQDAVNKRKIPGSLCRDWDHKKSIPDTTLAWKSGLHAQTIRKLIRNGKIKARPIPNGPFMILRKDNPNIAEVLENERTLREEKAKIKRGHATIKAK